jgi:hypothetical protein
MTRKWSTVSGAATAIGAYGRNGTNGLRVGQSGSAGSVTWNLPSNVATVIVGVAAKFTQPGVATAFLYLMDAGTIQVYLQFNTDASISVYNGNGTLLGTTAAGILPSYTAAHNYIEVKVLFHNSAGTVEIRINGSPTAALSLTGKDTTNTANAYITQVQLINSAPAASQESYYDDFYICDTTGSEANNFLGDVRIEYLAPSGAGTTTNLTPTAGSNYQCVDDNPANDDTDYVSSSTPGDKDTYAMGNLSSTLGTVVAVAVVTTDRKDDAGTRTHSHRVRLSGTESVSSAFSPTTSYLIHQSFFHTKPGGGAWSIADVNSVEAGVELTT